MEPVRPHVVDHMIVPLDGSHLGEVAIAPAIALADRLQAQVTLLHVLERNAPSTIHSDRHLTGRTEAETYLQGVATRFAAAGITAEHHTHPNPEGDVAASVAEHARELDADLLVICTHGHGGPRDWFTGLLAQRVIRRVGAPVVLVRPHDASASSFAPRSVLVALDGTKEGESILPAACTVAGAFDAGLDLVITVPTLSTVLGNRAATARLTPSATTAALELEAATAADYVSGLADRYDTAGYPTRAEVFRGDPVRTILDLAARNPGSLLALATHGRTGFDALWSASVGSRVVGRASSPLLLVRPEEGRSS